ncbi:hypothetical protein HWV07_06870 [Natronomonas salina]|uniref:hypothetical protein n=1 Tax=Natronomonas salina TaxID=1710540 RepID=UPI0015B5AE53|nr:hypothetical protein [Natronomonas salina]QLD88771.1 hypothetical protein HWV07_06870 [Natronomonas salina]
MVAQLRGLLSGSIMIPTLGFVFYPVLRFKQMRSTIIYDSLYLIAVFASLGGVLAYPSVMPVGFGDVHTHQAIIEQQYSDGHIFPENPAPSFNFIGYYVFTILLIKLLNSSLAMVAKFSPVILLMLTVLLFYWTISRKYLSPRVGVLGALLFGLQYGVYRFSIEYRTLNLALPLAVLIFALVFSYSNPQHNLNYIFNMVYVRQRILGIILIAAFTTVHFTSVFLMAIMIFLIAAVSASYKDKSNALFYSILLVLILFVYLAYIGGGFDRTISTIFTGSIVPLFFAEDAVASNNPDRAIGAGTVLVTWLVRTGFLLASVALGCKWLFGERDPDTAKLFVCTSVFGFLALLPMLGVDIILNPGRLLTFFAIPYALIYASGVETVYKDTGSWKRAVSSAGILLLCCLVVLSVLSPLPSVLIGDTSYIQDSYGEGEENYQLNEQNEDAKIFALNRLQGNSTIGSNVPRIYYTLWIGTNNPRYLITMKQCEDNIYSNGKINICVK